MRQPPSFGQPIRRDSREQPPVSVIDANRFEQLADVLERITETMSILIREIAGLSITKITDEVTVFPVEIVGVDQILVKVAPTSIAQVGARYLIGVKVDRGAVVETLPLEEITFSQNDIDGLLELTFPFTVVDMQQDVESFIVEAFLDASIASVRVTKAPGAVGVVTGIAVEIDTGITGLAGFIVDISIVDPVIAKIVEVTFPPQFPLNQFNPDPVNGPTVKISGADIANIITGREVGVLLATIGFEGLALGTTDIDVNIMTLDGDKGFPIRHTLTVDSFTVS